MDDVMKRQFVKNTLPPRLRPSAVDIVYKIYSTRFVSPDFAGCSGIINESSWCYSESVNEWLTENCIGLWGFFVETCIIADRMWLLTSTFCKEQCRPYIAFQNRTDAILFKLNLPATDFIEWS
jgi:hypothetical protein